MNVDSPVNVISLFSGAGGLDLGIRSAIPSSRVVVYVEREAYACASLVARMEEGALDTAPICTDVTEFNGFPWRGLVDCVAGGFPCQDISNAGKRAGIGGERSGLWAHFARIVGEAQPRLVIVENVAALRTRGLDQVLSDLAALGFDAEWGCYRASDVGAPHKRERLFIFAYSDREFLRQQPEPVAGGRSADVLGVNGGAFWRQAKPELCGVANGVANRVDRLRLCGNGVVPQQAAFAIKDLLGRALK